MEFMSDIKSIPDKLELFENMLTKAWEDGVESKDEFWLLRSLKMALGITDDEYNTLKENVMNNIDVDWLFFLEDENSAEAKGFFELDEPNKEYLDKFEIYRDVLTQVLEDNVVSEDELYLLASLRRFMGITPEAHKEIEDALRDKYEKSEEVIKRLTDIEKQL